MAKETKLVKKLVSTEKVKRSSFDDGILLKHNQQAYVDLINAIKKDGKACAIRATGTGKMYLALKWLKDNPNEPFVYIAPTNVILNRFVDTIISTFFPDNYEDFANVTLDDKINYIKNKLDFNLQLYTYSRLNSMEVEELQQIKARRVVVDEFHRCGATKWGQSVNLFLESHPDIELMGLTATPIRPSDGKNMVEEMFNGKIASELSLADAMEQGILPIPIMVNAIYSFEDEIVSLENKIKDKHLDPKKRKELQEKLKEAKILIGKAGGIKEVFAPFVVQVIQDKGKQDIKLVVFCKDIADRDQKMHECKSWFPGMKIKKYSLTSKESKKIIDSDDENLRFTEKVIRAFEDDDSKGVKLLFAVDILNEGLHVKGIDGVIMLRSTGSNIIFLQQLGRALAVDTKRKTKPVVFDLVNNVEVLEEDLTEFKKLFNKKDSGLEIDFSEGLKIFEEILEIRAEISDLLKLAKGFTTQTVEDLIAPLVSYYKEFGSIKKVSINTKYQYRGTDYNLGDLVMKLRKRYLKGTLSESKIEQLEKIGIAWVGSGYDLDNIRVEFKDFVEEFLKFYKRYERLPKAGENLYSRWNKWANPENLNEEEKAYLKKHQIEFRVISKDNVSVPVIKFVSEYLEFCKTYGRKPRNNEKRTKGYIEGEDSLYQRWRGWTNPNKKLTKEEKEYLETHGIETRVIEPTKIGNVRKSCIEFVERFEEFVQKHNRNPREVRNYINVNDVVEGESALYSAYLDWTDPLKRRKNPTQEEIEYLRAHNIEIRKEKQKVGNIRPELIDTVEKYFEFVKKYGRPPSYKKTEDYVEGEIKLYNNMNDWKNPSRKNLNEDEIRYLEEKGFKLSMPKVKNKPKSSIGKNSTDGETVGV